MDKNPRSVFISAYFMTDSKSKFNLEINGSLSGLFAIKSDVSREEKQQGSTFGKLRLIFNYDFSPSLAFCSTLPQRR